MKRIVLAALLLASCTKAIDTASVSFNITSGTKARLR